MKVQRARAKKVEVDFGGIYFSLQGYYIPSNSLITISKNDQLLHLEVKAASDVVNVTQLDPEKINFQLNNSENIGITIRKDCLAFDELHLIRIKQVKRKFHINGQEEYLMRILLDKGKITLKLTRMNRKEMLNFTIIIKKNQMKIGNHALSEADLQKINEWRNVTNRILNKQKFDEMWKKIHNAQAVKTEPCPEEKSAAISASETCPEEKSAAISASETCPEEKSAAISASKTPIT